MSPRRKQILYCIFAELLVMSALATQLITFRSSIHTMLVGTATRQVRMDIPLLVS